MSEQWADQLITHVRYDAAETHIVNVRSRPDYGHSLGQPVEMSRQRVIELIGDGTAFATVYQKQGNSSWSFGAEVRVVTIDGVKYIRTDADQTKADNLGELPRF